jgi:amino acid transporter
MTDVGLMARKSVSDIIASGEAEGRSLAKALGPFSITAMGIGAIIGAGIFVLTGTAAAQASMIVRTWTVWLGPAEFSLPCIMSTEQNG